MQQKLTAKKSFNLYNDWLGVPPWSLFLSKNYRDFEASSLGILVFRGTFRPI